MGTSGVVYRPRDAAASPLYRVVLNHIESFAQQRLADSPAGPFAEPSLRAFLECGVPRFGVARFACRQCATSCFVAFSCKRRLACPSCDAKRAVVESERALDELLPRVAYRQWVLVMPKRLRYFVHRDARLAGEISGLLAETLTDFLRRRAGAPEGAAPAQLHALQRFGSTVNLHIHDHAVVSDGVFSLEGGRLRFHQAPAPTADELARLLEALRRRILKRLRRQGAIPEAAAADMLAWPHSGFSLNAQTRVEAEDREGLARLLRYVLRPALSLKALSYDAKQERVFYRPSKGRPGAPKILEWSPVEFLERFAAIIPPPRRHLVRYYGALAPRSRLRPGLTKATQGQAGCARLEQGYDVGGLAVVLDAAAAAAGKVGGVAARAWAACLRRIFEVDPLLCPRCGGEMTLAAMIVEDLELERILRHQGLAIEFPKTKPARSPPLPMEDDGRQIDPCVEASDDRQDWPSGDSPA